MNWFEIVFGISEQEYQKFPHKIKMNNNILSTPKGHYQLGNFNNVSLYLLRKICIQQLKTSDEQISNTSQISHIYCQKYGPKSLISIMNQYPGALFQVASKFNCLEFTQAPEKGISDYIFDETQGPQCALATAPSTFYRNYLIPISNDGNISYGQSSSNQINNLELTEMLINNSKKKYWSVNNGIITHAENLSLLNKYLLTNRDLVRDTIQVGILINSDLVLRKRVGPLNFEYNQYPFPKISQVYCSAISCRMTQISLELWELLARIVLEAIYEATLWAGYLNYLQTGNNRIFLTFVGGGVFGNKKSWIISAIKRTLNIAQQYQLPLKIFLIHFEKIDKDIKKEVSDRNIS